MNEEEAGKDQNCGVGNKNETNKMVEEKKNKKGNGEG